MTARMHLTFSRHNQAGSPEPSLPRISREGSLGHTAARVHQGLAHYPFVNWIFKPIGLNYELKFLFLCKALPKADFFFSKIKFMIHFCAFVE